MVDTTTAVNFLGLHIARQRLSPMSTLTGIFGIRDQASLTALDLGGSLGCLRAYNSFRDLGLKFGLLRRIGFTTVSGFKSDWLDIQGSEEGFGSRAVKLKP